MDWGKVECLQGFSESFSERRMRENYTTHLPDSEEICHAHCDGVNQLRGAIPKNATAKNTLVFPVRNEPDIPLKFISGVSNT